MKDQLSSPSTGKMATPTPVKTLRIITEKLIPWIESHGVSRIVLAKSPLTSVSQPERVRFSNRRLRSSAVKLRGPGLLGELTARWPQDGLHASRFSTFVFVLEGEADFSIGSAVIHCPQDHAILFPPGTPYPDGSHPHWERPDLSQARSDIFWLQWLRSGVRCDLCHTRGEYHNDRVPGERCFIPDSQLFHIAETVLNEMIQRRAEFDVVCRAQLLSLFVLLRRHLKEGEVLPKHIGIIQTMPGRRRVGFSEPGAVVAHAKDYIDSHLGEALTVPNIARAAYTSRTNLTRLFRAETRMSVWEYVTACRMEEAKSLLKETDISICEVSEIVGFSAVSHFCTRFAHIVGESPATFRQRQRKKLIAK